MDPSLWGQLQYHMDLKVIYAKLPFREFFQMRLVCKEWNRLASNREFLEESFKDPVPAPYFILPGGMFGLLAYTASSGRWTWTPLPPRCGDFAAAGLLCSFAYLQPQWQSLMHPSEQEVFSIHTRAFYRLPQPPERSSLFPSVGYVGLMVDTSARPYTFQAVLGDEDIDTYIFDSRTNSWTKRLSSGPSSFPLLGTTSCAHTKRFLYLKQFRDWTREDPWEINYYDLESDEWGIFPPPGDGTWDDTWHRDIGSWNGSLFVVVLDDQSDSEHSIRVWELADNAEDDWMVYNAPKDLCSWLTYANDDVDYESVEPMIHNKFCDEYLLIYTVLVATNENVAERFVMCNLATKSWERIQLPVDAFRWKNTRL